MSDDTVWIKREEADRMWSMVNAVRDVIEKATAVAFHPDGSVYAYAVSAGPMHRLVAAAQSAGMSVGLANIPADPGEAQ